MPHLYLVPPDHVFHPMLRDYILPNVKIISSPQNYVGLCVYIYIYIYVYNNT